MQGINTNTKIVILSYLIVTIPFLEFINSNRNNIDINIFYHLVFFILVVVFISLINFFLLKVSSKSQIYILSLSFSFGFCSALR